MTTFESWLESRKETLDKLVAAPIEKVVAAAPAKATPAVAAVAGDTDVTMDDVTPMPAASLIA